MRLYKLSVTLVVLLQACAGGGSSGGSLGGTPSEKIVAKLDSGEECFPVALNNNSQVLFDCSDGSKAIWSKDLGLKALPQAPIVMSISPPNIPLYFVIDGFSDDGKVLLHPDAPFDIPNIEQIPPYSYLFDGATYIKLDGTYRALSDNGKYLAGFNDDFQLTLLDNFKHLEISALHGLNKILSIKAVNDKGEVAATVSYGDSKHTFENYYAAKLGQSESTILPPALRPDINSSSAVDINSSGDMLIDSVEQSDNGKSRALIVGIDKVIDVYPVNLEAETYGHALNSNNVALFTIDNQAFIYEEGRGTSTLEDRIGQAVSGYTLLLNDNNQVLVNGEGESEFQILELN